MKAAPGGGGVTQRFDVRRVARAHLLLPQPVGPNMRPPCMKRQGPIIVLVALNVLLASNSLSTARADRPAIGQDAVSRQSAATPGQPRGRG